MTEDNSLEVRYKEIDIWILKMVLLSFLSVLIGIPIILSTFIGGAYILCKILN